MAAVATVEPQAGAVEYRRIELTAIVDDDEQRRARPQRDRRTLQHIHDAVGVRRDRRLRRPRSRRTELTLESPSPLVGYCILNADSLDEAERLVSSMPIIDSVRVYEAHSM